MELTKQTVHTNLLKFSKNSQVTINDDFNITDTKKDIEKIIAQNGEVFLEDTFTADGKVTVHGVVHFRVLYKTTDSEDELECYENEIPFEDTVSDGSILRKDTAESICRLEDLSVGIINSRKLEVRGLLENSVNVFSDDLHQVAVDISEKEEARAECQYKTVTVTGAVLAKHDVFRIREEIEIPQNKPNIKEVLWAFVSLRNLETKAATDKIVIRGEVEIFVIYKGEEEHMPVQYLFLVRTINEEIECMGARDDMILVADCVLGEGAVTVRQDGDGEERILFADYTVDMNIKLYEDQEVRLISDVYSPQVSVVPKKEEMTYENLIMRNNAKTKLTVRKKIKEGEAKLLSVCYVYGSVEIDDVAISAEQVLVRGTVKANVLYVAADDEPMHCAEQYLPFEYSVDTMPITEQASVRIVPTIDQLQTSLLNGEEVEIKAQVNLGISIFVCGTVDVVEEIAVEPIDYEKKAKMPGIVGHVVKSGDTLWSLARTYYTTTAMIKEINNLESEEIKPGDRLILVKS